eukprot:scaffold2114_cov31-Prasinocladus_malaysianus.AAC.1
MTTLEGSQTKKDDRETVTLMGRSVCLFLMVMGKSDHSWVSTSPKSMSVRGPTSMSAFTPVPVTGRTALAHLRKGQNETFCNFSK